jgi:hypothetical protein
MEEELFLLWIGAEWLADWRLLADMLCNAETGWIDADSDITLYQDTTAGQQLYEEEEYHRYLL